MNTIGTVLKERYEIIAQLGKGGMSTVYLAKDLTLECYWAVKMVKYDSSIDMEAFLKEVELLSTLNHSDIPRIVDRIEQNNNYYVVMDFIDGISLGRKVAAEGPLPEQDVVEWAKMLCDVLEYLHTVRKNPIVYRDMKPDNVMLTQAGRVKLIDFGIALECKRGIRQTAASVGTRGYAAPEQYKSGSNILDERTDIYSLGATLYYLVTGLTPDMPPKAVIPIRKVNPGLSEGLEYILLKCTSYDPKFRYQNCNELRYDLDNIEQLSGKYRKRQVRKLIRFAASLVACITCFSIAYVGYSHEQEDKEDNYQYYYRAANESIRSGDTDAAIDYFVKAIEYKPSSVETYLLYFNTLLPEEGDEEYLQKTKDAIDIMRNSYLDNSKSFMYEQETLMYQVMKKCLEVNDTTYAQYAVDYITKLKDAEYDAADLDSCEVIASNCANNFSTQDFKAFESALETMEEVTDDQITDMNEKLSNYYTIMVMYAAYPTYLTDAYEKVSEVGEKAKTILDTNMESEQLTFHNILPMYELVASGLYNHSLTVTDTDQKVTILTESLTWFDYLVDLNDDLSETLWLKKANCYRALYEIYSKQADDQSKEYFDKAVKEYNEVVKVYDSSFLAYVNLTQIYLNQELLKTDATKRDFAKTMTYYKKVKEIKSSNKNLSNIELSQFSSLKKTIASVGLEE